LIAVLELAAGVKEMRVEQIQTVFRAARLYISEKIALCPCLDNKGPEKAE
jgi:hypothetical protein